MLTQEDIKIIKELLQEQGVQFDQKLGNLGRNLKMDIAATEASLRQEIHTTEDNLRKEMKTEFEKVNQRFDTADRRLDKVDQQLSLMAKEIAEYIIPIFATNEELEKVKEQLDNHINNHKFG